MVEVACYWRAVMIHRETFLVGDLIEYDLFVYLEKLIPKEVVLAFLTLILFVYKCYF